MRTTILLLAMAVLVAAVLAACRPRDESASDSAAPDSVPADDTAAAAAVSSDTASTSAMRPGLPRAPRAARPAGASTRDSALPPDDSIRAMRPEVPQVTPPKRPRTWRGFKLPEEMPVRTPVDTIKTLAPAESLMKGDSTKPPTADR